MVVLLICRGSIIYSIVIPVVNMIIIIAATNIIDWYNDKRSKIDGRD